MNKQVNKWLPYVIATAMVVPLGIAVIWEILSFLRGSGGGEAMAGFAMLGLFALVGGGVILWILILNWSTKILARRPY